MLYTYQELCEKKDKVEILNWDNITKDQLEKLFIDEHIPNSMIAELYDVSSSKVVNKRNKWDIKINSAKYLYKRFEENNLETFKNLNQDSKERLLDSSNIDWISKALTHYIFRNGPVEDMHANHQLSQEDMKTLNKYMVNKIAGLLKLVNDGKWLKIELMLSFLKNYGVDWDPCEYDTEEIDMIFKHSLGIWEDDEKKEEKVGV